MKGFYAKWRRRAKSRRLASSFQAERGRGQAGFKAKRRQRTSAFDWLFSSRRFPPTRLVLRAGDNSPAARFNSFAWQFFSSADRPRMRVSIFAPASFFSFLFSQFLLISVKIKGSRRLGGPQQARRRSLINGRTPEKEEMAMNSSSSYAGTLFHKRFKRPCDHARLDTSPAHSAQSPAHRGGTRPY